ncbi:MAG: methyltransferase domain-containing protein, partial [Chitinophagaceae bacterium]
MHKDEFFKEELSKPSDFKFSSKVAKVFDDMVNRSVPFYEEMQRMIAEIAADHSATGTNVYDLGCSTGTSLMMMDQTVARDIRFVGIDDSPEMLTKCDSKLQEAGFNRPYSLEVADLNAGINIQNASVVLLCLTLQFVRPLFREKLLKSIIEGMTPGGILIIVEKILAEDSIFNRDFIKY